MVALVLVFAPFATASAHQDGCHRWHSCPSDTGSYVCGDLGYTSGCPKTSTTKVAPKSTVKEVKTKPAKVIKTPKAKAPKAAKKVKTPAKAKVIKPVAEKVYVNGYYKKDGTYVKGYWRSK